MCKWNVINSFCASILENRYGFQLQKCRNKFTHTDIHHCKSTLIGLVFVFVSVRVRKWIFACSCRNDYLHLLGKKKKLKQKHKWKSVRISNWQEMRFQAGKSPIFWNLLFIVYCVFFSDTFTILNHYTFSHDNIRETHKLRDGKHISNNNYSVRCTQFIEDKES